MYVYVYVDVHERIHDMYMTYTWLKLSDTISAVCPNRVHNSAARDSQKSVP
jgi:hypothetical protein